MVDCELEEEKLAPGVMVSPEKLWLKLFSEWTCRSTSSMKDSEKEKRSWMFDDGGGWLLGGLFLRSRAGIDSLCEGMVGAGLWDKGELFCCCTEVREGGLRRVYIVLTGPRHLGGRLLFPSIARRSCNLDVSVITGRASASMLLLLRRLTCRCFVGPSLLCSTSVP